MNRGQLAEKARQRHKPTSENLTEGQLIKFIRKDLMRQTTPRSSDHLGFGKHGTKTYQETIHMRYTWTTSAASGSNGGGSALTLEAQEVRIMAEDARCPPGTITGERHDMTYQTARREEPLRRDASPERT